MNYEKLILKSHVLSDINRIENIIACGIFNIVNSHHPLKNAAFIELVICLNDLLQKSKALGVPIVFTDDIPAEIKNKSGESINITDLVSLVRNAVCHISSGTSFLIQNEEFKINNTFIILRGRMEGTFISCGEDNHFDQPTYEDDFCFNFGKLLLFYNRHILRALNEVKQKLLPTIADPEFGLDFTT